MKKLLSLLSVLTISGTAVPITIAASPYKKEENINSKINYSETKNLENLKRNKRDNNINLNVPQIRQEGSQYCGPATAESILWYFGLSTSNVLNNVNQERPNHPYISFQHYLSSLMHTNSVQSLNDNIGTSTVNWASIVNFHISRYDLNNRRKYSITELVPGSIHFSEFNNLINISLENNTPVALAYIGILPEQQEDSTDDQHFIVINGVTRPELSMSGLGSDRYYDEYTYMEPSTGNFGTISSNNLSLLIRGQGIYRPTNFSNNRLHSYLIHYNPNVLSNIVQTIPINKTEPMEFGNCNYLIQNFENFCNVNLYFNQKNRFTRQINNNDYCPIINKYNPFFQKNDVFEVDYQFFSHDKIKLKISLKTALGIKKMFFENNQHKFKEYLKELKNA